MDALVHFAVGLAGGLLALLLVDWPPRWEFLASFGSGIWAMVPDGHWMLRVAGVDGPAAVWKSFHGTPVADVFWLHRLLDRSETGAPKVEMGVALVGLTVVVGLYFLGNDWSAG
jgi:hypothetical protein